MPVDNWTVSVQLVGVTIGVLVLSAGFIWRWLSGGPKPKEITLRISRIPIDDNKDHLISNINSVIEREPALREAITTPKKFTWTRQGRAYACATATVTTKLPAGAVCQRFGKAGERHEYNYDSEFQGITPIYEGENADVDIVAVPGLGSHALGSWKSTKNNDVWLRDYLPKDIPNTRVLLYGYDTSLSNSSSKASLKDLGIIFMENLKTFRDNDGTSRRPIILIGHSLGGLLIKEALLCAKERGTDANIDLYKASFGLIFFGVPNSGLRNHELQTIVKDRPNKALIDSIVVDNDSEPSSYIETLADRFSRSFKDDYRTVAFFERKHSQIIKLFPDGTLRKTEEMKLLVTQESATRIGSNVMADRDTVPVQTDHSGLVKYDEIFQGNYPIVKARLQSLIDDAKVKVPTRFIQDKWQSQTEERNYCLQSLALKEINDRHGQIFGAANGTYRWFLEHETVIEWSRQSRGLLWIKGKPGSGKSTLLKFALPKLRRLYEDPELTLSFFFTARGDELQRTPLGLYRSILHQLLKTKPETLSDIVEYFAEQQKTIGKHGEKWEWQVEKLQEFLKSSLAKVLERSSVILCIDALDECGYKPAIEMVEYLKTLHSSLPPTRFRFGILFSCRHYPIHNHYEGSTMELDRENATDIAKYVEDAFHESNLDEEVQDAICQRAQGVFLWACYVVERVCVVAQNAGSSREIQSQIKDIPQNLNEIYHKLIQAIENKTDALKLIQWICFSNRPLTTQEVQWAIAIDMECKHQSLHECKSSDDFIGEERLDRRIKV